MADIIKNHSRGILDCKGNTRKITGRDDFRGQRVPFCTTPALSGSKFEAAGGLFPGVEAAAADKAGNNAGLDRRYLAGRATI